MTPLLHSKAISYHKQSQGGKKMSTAGRYYFGHIEESELANLDLQPVTMDPLKVIEFNNLRKTTAGHVGLSFRRQSGNLRHSSIKQAVYDGDTVTVGAFGNLSTRFIGIDTPEVKFALLESRTIEEGSTYTSFVKLDDERWAKFLANPFTMNASSYLDKDIDLPPYGLSIGLYEYLRPNLVRDAGKNHRIHAQAALRYLENQIDNDLKTLVNKDGSKRFESEDEFRFYLRFAHEIMDGYGRLLCIIKPDEPNPPSGKRQKSYNLRMLKSGLAMPYFIWPNLEPWRKQEFILKAIVKRGQAHALAEKKGSTLKTVRRYVRRARKNKKGIFGDANYDQNQTGPLQLMPNEIRFLGARRAPSRYVIDLSENTPWPDTLLHPENYYRIENLEDRLYIPGEYVPLFAEREGWQVQRSPNA
ncbi:MAG: hypothetical protein GY832_46265 [Chloroflexi bacterium]|nr:hypothetical protein [Chloroflexota bacterium]